MGSVKQTTAMNSIIATSRRCCFSGLSVSISKTSCNDAAQCA